MKFIDLLNFDINICYVKLFILYIILYLFDKKKKIKKTIKKIYIS